jgi:hypothetical protein
MGRRSILMQPEKGTPPEKERWVAHLTTSSRGFEINSLLSG